MLTGGVRLLAVLAESLLERGEEAMGNAMAPLTQASAGWE